MKELGILLRKISFATPGPMKLRGAKLAFDSASTGFVVDRDRPETQVELQAIRLETQGIEAPLSLDETSVEWSNAENLAGFDVYLNDEKVGSCNAVQEGANVVVFADADAEKKPKLTGSGDVVSIRTRGSDSAKNGAKVGVRVARLKIGGETTSFAEKTVEYPIVVLQKFVEPELTQIIAVGPNNPRNSEGAFAALTNGDLSHVYTRYYGKSGGDNDTARLMSRRSSDGGKTWTKNDVLVLENEGKLNAMSVSLLRLANGELAMFYLVKEANDDCIPYLRISTDDAISWSDRIRIVDGVSYNVVNNDRIVQLADGTLLTPIALHPKKADGGLDWNATIYCRYSNDNGRTWNSGAPTTNPGVTFQEPGVVQLADESVLMNIRSSGGAQYYARSTDGGKSWTDPVKSPLDAPLSPALIKRIPGSDRFIAVWKPFEKGWGRTKMDVAVLSPEETPSKSANASICRTELGNTRKFFSRRTEVFYSLFSIGIKEFTSSKRPDSTRKRRRARLDFNRFDAPAFSAKPTLNESTTR